MLPALREAARRSKVDIAASARPELLVQLYPELSRSAAGEVAALAPMDLLFGQVIGMSPVVLPRAGSGPDGATGKTAAVDAPISGTLPPDIDSWSNIITSIPDLDEVALGHGLIPSVVNFVLKPDRRGVYDPRHRFYSARWSSGCSKI